jgi:uncharacterized protein (DUF1330 family)
LFRARPHRYPSKKRESDHMAYYVLFEFPSLAAAQLFYVSPEYQSLKALRQEASSTNVVGVEGV